MSDTFEKLMLTIKINIKFDFFPSLLPLNSHILPKLCYLLFSYPASKYHP